MFEHFENVIKVEALISGRTAGIKSQYSRVHVHWSTGPADFQFDPGSCMVSNLRLSFGCHQRKKSSSWLNLSSQSWIHSDLLILSPFCPHCTRHFKFCSSDNLKNTPGHLLCGPLVLRNGSSNLWKVGISLCFEVFLCSRKCFLNKQNLRCGLEVFTAFASVLESVFIFSFLELICVSVRSWRHAVVTQTNLHL